MSHSVSGRIGWMGSRLALAIVPAASLMLGGCAQFGGLDSSYNPFATAKAPEALPPGQLPANELQKATEYWGKEYAQKPQDLQTALNYARNLKALGDKKRAASVLQQASMFHSMDRELNSELGRLAIELDQIALAKKLLEAADDPSKPDWRVVSARGTVMAKEGRSQEAIGYFERALALAPDQPSVMNNLALAYAMNGQAAKAEELLRNANVVGRDASKVRQNLALVLGLQGKYEEATKVGSEVAGSSAATANTDILKKMVKLEPKPMVPEQTAPAAWSTNVVAATGADGGWKGVVIPSKSPAQALRPATADAAVSAPRAAKVAGAGAPIDLRPAAEY